MADHHARLTPDEQEPLLLEYIFGMFMVGGLIGGLVLPSPASRYAFGVMALGFCALFIWWRMICWRLYVEVAKRSHRAGSGSAAQEPPHG